MNPQAWLFLLLPVAAASGWWVGRQSRQKSRWRSNGLSDGYFAGLNYLVNEQPDKAIEAFIQVLGDGPDTVETTLTLGKLFRRRGEVDKAIQLHQNLVARPSLTTFERGCALLELGQDYLSAGVLDRAESLFHEVAALSPECIPESQRFLMRIYERERDWQRAIEMAQKYQSLTQVSVRHRVAQYHCELAHIALEHGQHKNAVRELKQALKVDRHCARASIMLGRLAVQQEQFKSAIRSFEQVLYQDPSIFTDVIQDLCVCYLKLNQPAALSDYLNRLNQERPSITVALASAETLKTQGLPEEAAHVLAEHLKRYPSIQGLAQWIQQYLAHRKQVPVRDELELLHGLIDRLLKQKPLYQCQGCGFSSRSLDWHCPSCHQWATIKPLDPVEGVEHAKLPTSAL